MIGERDRLITVERNSGTSENAFGEVTESWTTYSTFWALVNYGKGVERRQSAADASEQPVTFHIEEGTTANAITTADRIQYGGSTYDIESVAPYKRKRVELTGIRRTSA